jgi:hypothetical protein
METANEQKNGNFDAELTRLRGDNEALTQRIEALTRIVENLVITQPRNADTTNTPIENESALENPLDDDSKGSLDPTFTKMAGRLKFSERDYSDDGSVERRVSIYARGEDKEKILKPMQKTQEVPKFSWELTSLRFNPIPIFFAKIYEYQARYEVTVRGACYVTTDIRNILISKNPGNELSDQTFFSLSNSQLLNLIRREVRPINRLDFLDYLTSGLKFEVLENFQLTVLSFKKWYNQLTMYVYNFVNRIDFLLEMKLDDKSLDIPIDSTFNN